MEAIKNVENEIIWTLHALKGIDTYESVVKQETLQYVLKLCREYEAHEKAKQN